LHAIVLTTRRDAFDAGPIASRVALAPPLALRDRLNPLKVHVFSLVTAHRLTFERDVFERRPAQSDAARVA
jgi:hypothetical protein